MLSVVRNRCQMEWLKKPVQVAELLQTIFKKENGLLVDQEVQDMLKGTIEKVLDSPGQFVSNICLVEKQDGGSRPGINLKSLNHLVKYKHFQMNGLETPLNSVMEGKFLTKLDLRDAYLSISLHPGDPKFLRFGWQGNLFQFRVFPIRLSSAPRVFTQM